jgi:predicted nucleic acid-binding protein
MSGFLVDTNVLSEAVRTKPEPRVLDWIGAADETLLYLSVLTLGEIRKGLALLPQGKRRTRIEAWLDVEVQSRFAGRILPITSAVADRWGLLTAEARKKVRPLATIDALLAATALEHNFTIVTRNIRDFRDTHVLLLNPWDS